MWMVVIRRKDGDFLRDVGVDKWGWLSPDNVQYTSYDQAVQARKEYESVFTEYTVRLRIKR